MVATWLVFGVWTPDPVQAQNGPAQPPWTAQQPDAAPPSDVLQLQPSEPFLRSVRRLPLKLELGGGAALYAGDLGKVGPGGLFRGALRFCANDVEVGIWLLRAQHGVDQPVELSPIKLTGFGLDMRLNVPLRNKAFALLHMGFGMVASSSPMPGAEDGWGTAIYGADYSMRFRTPWAELGLGLEYRLARHLRWNVMVIYGARVRDLESDQYFATRSHNHFFLTSSITIDFSGR
ncbi:hypothetical protein KKC22_17850 [Myxococcota bacterium]|nr:hypothetical protein [Myxococcota bacterium]